ncbi:MAG TPA: glycosyltransferase family 2 protein [Nitrospirota bacterium]|nr:glycosyltransferase family 2 protein [Nitrospirota bacterium]
MGALKKKITVLIPCRNEVRYIVGCLRNIYDFAPPVGGFEVIVIDGMSNDGTREVLDRLQQQYPDLIIIDNPHKTVPHAMNLGIRQARGEYLVRADVRCIHPKSYLLDLLELSESTQADNVGGVLIPLPGDTYIQKSIALAYKSPIAMGGALRDRGDFVGETDTVYGGCFRKSRLIEIGMYDECMVRNQDDELSFRLRKLGGRILQHGKIKIFYHPRSRYTQLFKQFMQYGYWKVAVIAKHPQQASFRHFLPAMLVCGLTLLCLVLPFSHYALTGLIVYATCYVLPVALESLRIVRKNDIALWPGVFNAIVTIHVSFGIGFVISLLCKAFKTKPKLFETLSR